MTHRPIPFEERLAAKTVRLDNGCLIWTGRKYANGYGVFTTGSSRSGNLKQLLVHRVAFELVYGPVPEGHVVDHSCHNRDLTCSGGWNCLHRPCVEPAHLEAVLQRENLLRGQTIAASYAARTHCKNNHEFTLENTRMRGGTRECRACNRERQAATKARRRARLAG